MIIDEYRGATLSIGELGIRNVVSLHCDSEREVPHGSHGFSSLQAHIAVAIILAYVVVELSSIQKCSKLSENVFVLKHSSQLFLAAKL